MKLIIMRHGEASWSASSDQERPLTETGRVQAQSTAEQLQGRGLTRIMASPYLRAQETAEIVGTLLELPVETLPGITPDDSPFEAMNALPVEGDVLIVSHMPLVSALTGLLCEGTVNSGPGFGTAYAAVLNMELPGSGMATLTDLITPH